MSAISDLPTNQAAATRKLLEYCGLAWEDECLAFHQNPPPAPPQLRRLIYNSSISK